MYGRKPMGFINSGHSFVNKATRLLEGTNSKIEVNDVILGAHTMEELIEKFKAFLEHCRIHNIKLSKRKLQMGMMVLFAGMLISGGDGSCQPAPARAEATNELTHTTTVSDVRSLLPGVGAICTWMADTTLCGL